jgi:hypothetical protein
MNLNFVPLVRILHIWVSIKIYRLKSNGKLVLELQAVTSRAVSWGRINLVSREIAARSIRLRNDEIFRYKQIHPPPHELLFCGKRRQYDFPATANIPRLYPPPSRNLSNLLFYWIKTSKRNCEARLYMVIVRYQLGRQQRRLPCQRTITFATCGEAKHLVSLWGAYQTHNLFPQCKPSQRCNRLRNRGLQTVCVNGLWALGRRGFKNWQ